MDSELRKRFNEEINRYRNALLFYAKKCEWDTFKINAGKLFDYVESIEISEIEREFFRITKILLFVVFLMVILVYKMNPSVYPGLEKIKDIVTLIAIGSCGFEVYFFFSFRMYMQNKSIFYKKRKERFIRDIENDFRNMVLSTST
jgi:hypothetical protein